MFEITGLYSVLIAKSNFGFERNIPGNISRRNFNVLSLVNYIEYELGNISRETFSLTTLIVC